MTVVRLDEVIGALQVYVSGLLGEDAQVLGKSMNGRQEAAYREAGKIPVALPQFIDLFKTKEHNELYFKFLATFEVSRHLFGGFVVDPDLLEGKLRVMEEERTNRMLEIEAELKGKEGKEAQELKHRLAAFGEQGMELQVLKEKSSLADILQRLIRGNSNALATCYQLVELARVSYLMRERWQGLSNQMDGLFAEGARKEGASIRGVIDDPRKNDMVDQLSLYAVAPEQAHKGKDGAQTLLVRSEGVRFFNPVRSDGATTADSVVQAVRLYRWVKGCFKELTFSVLPTTLPYVEQLHQEVRSSKEGSSHQVRSYRTLVQNEALLFDEFDMKSGTYVDKFCRVLAGDASMVKQKGKMFPFEQRVLDEIVNAFEEVRPEGRVLRKKEKSGELDGDRVVDYMVDLREGRTPDERVYERVLRSTRDVAVIVLVDASGSVNRFLTKDVTIFDVVKESVFYISRGLEAIGDEYAIFAHQSWSAYDVQVMKAKGLGERKEFAQVMRGLMALHAERHNHDGAVIRYATQLLDRWPAKTKIVLHMSDGEPKDVPLAVFEKQRDADEKKRGNWRDGYRVPLAHEPFKRFPYQGERAWADVKKAVYEASLRNVQVCHVRISEEPSAAAREVFGRYQVFVRDVRDLARALSEFYVSLTR